MVHLCPGRVECRKKLSRLSDADFVAKHILIPAIERLRTAGGLTAGEARALAVAASKTVIKAGDLSEALPGSPATRSKAVRRILDRQLLKPLTEGGRSYQLVFAPNDLTVHIVNRIDALGLLPRILREHPVQGAPSANRLPTTVGKRLADPASLWSPKNLEFPGISAVILAAQRPWRGFESLQGHRISEVVLAAGLPRGLCHWVAFPSPGASSTFGGTRQMCLV